MPRTLQACNGCKWRKVRCNGEPACQQCIHLNLECHYSAANSSARSRRNITRGAVIHAYKGSSPNSSRDAARQLAPRAPPLVSHKHSQPHPLLSFDAGFFTALLDDYSNSVFPFLPIIPEVEFKSAIGNADLDRDDRAFVYALAAVTMNMTVVGSRQALDESSHVTFLYTRALELRGTIMPNTPITIKSTMISLLASISLFAKRRNIDMGFYFLREAITGVQILQNNEAGRLERSSAEERLQVERLHWVLFVHERFVAITYNRSIALPELCKLSDCELLVETGLIEGFNQLIRLFRVIDADFVGHWLDRQSNSMTLAWIEKKQLEIGHDMDTWEREIGLLTDMQQIDLIVTRYWLHTLLWQMALSKFLLSSTTNETKDFMSIMFPIRLSRRLRSILAVMPQEAVEVHGTGIVQKIFEITNTIGDILVHVPTANSTKESYPHHLDDFLFLYHFLLVMSEFHPVEETVLRAKLEILQSQFPDFRTTGT